MDKSQQRGAPQSRQGGAEFFIPDLCAAQPLLITVLLAQLLVLVLVLIGSELPRFDWNLLATTSLFVQWVVLLNTALLCGLRAPLSALAPAMATAAVLSQVVVVTLLSSYAVRWLFPQWVSGDASVAWALRNGLIALILASIALRHFYLQQQLWLQEQAELRARLDSLRARIRPHFLFNTLNSIASLIAVRPVQAERAVEDLAELFRASLQEGEREASVADELRLCELYLDIESLRLGERLQVNWQVEDSMREQPMPSLMLQPLVENAVSHGISQIAAGGTVSVCVRREGKCLLAAVENPLPLQPAQRGGHGIALGNIEQRLQALYGERGQLTLHRQGGICRAELSYPLASWL